MGCYLSSPHAKRRYRDPADLDEEIVPLRYFGKYRVGSNLVPDDVEGLPSTHIEQHLASNSEVILYEAEIDHGRAFRCLRPIFLVFMTPTGWAWLAGAVANYGLGALCMYLSCDEACCWIRKEYSTRTFFRVYSNRIEFNHPTFRFLWGSCGCGSWNADNIVTHPFDRGAFGFHHSRTTIFHHMCCFWPACGRVVVRHRCQCNGPVWNRMFTDCGGWWCDEWLCQLLCCTYHYSNLAHPDEAAFACSIALQAYFEGRAITPQDMDRCLEFWRDNISEQTDPIGRKRPVCCEPYCIPCCEGYYCYRCTHVKRSIPYSGDQLTNEIREVYEKYERERARQVEEYKSFVGPVRQSTICRFLGCRRFFGRRGLIFCTEGCADCSRKAGDPAPGFEEHDIDDDWDASTVLMKVVGPPPANVVIRRWRWDPEKGANVLETYPENAFGEGDDKTSGGDAV